MVYKWANVYEQILHSLYHVLSFTRSFSMAAKLSGHYLLVTCKINMSSDSESDTTAHYNTPTPCPGPTPHTRVTPPTLHGHRKA